MISNLVFDTVNHTLSFDEEEYMPISIIRLDYSGQQLTFHLDETVSRPFGTLNGVHQDGALSPLLFSFLLLDNLVLGALSYVPNEIFKPSSKQILILVFKHPRKFRGNALLFLDFYFVFV